MFTRKQYMDKEVTHTEYYGQFVDGVMQEQVGLRIGVNRIINSKDKHLNDIPLKEWDNMEIMVRQHCGTSISMASGCGVSLSDCVCVAKAAAKQIKKGADNENR